MGWSVCASACVIMDGYDTLLLGSSYALPTFQRRVCLTLSANTRAPRVHPLIIRLFFLGSLVRRSPKVIKSPHHGRQAVVKQVFTLFKLARQIDRNLRLPMWAPLWAVSSEPSSSTDWATKKRSSADSSASFLSSDWSPSPLTFRRY